MNQKQLAVLRNIYSTVETMDPCSETYKKLDAFLDNQPIAILRTLAEARIKFISSMATNRVNQFARIAR